MRAVLENVTAQFRDRAHAGRHAAQAARRRDQGTIELDRRYRGARGVEMGKTHDQLDIDERYEIYRLRETGVCLREVGRMMGRSASTTSRELAG